jgi:hypothetical protein
MIFNKNLYILFQTSHISKTLFKLTIRISGFLYKIQLNLSPTPPLLLIAAIWKEIQ